MTSISTRNLIMSKFIGELIVFKSNHNTSSIDFSLGDGSRDGIIVVTKACHGIVKKIIEICDRYNLIMEVNRSGIVINFDFCAEEIDLEEIKK